MHKPFFAALLMFGFFASARALPDAPEFREYAVKAAFIINALKFIDWPEPLPQGQIRLCIVGDNPFGTDSDFMQGKTVKDRITLLKPLRTPPQPKDCQVVFIAGSEKDHLPEILKPLEGKDVLTVGDTTGFGERGVIMNFFQEAGNIRIQVNLDAAKRAGLKIDSRLLKLATIVSDKQS